MRDPVERSPEQEARVSSGQAGAAEQARAEAAASEARRAGEQAAQATPVVDSPVEPAAQIDDVPAGETSLEEPSQSPEN